MPIKMSRNQRRLWHKENKTRPKIMTAIPKVEWPHLSNRKQPIKVWASRDYLAQAFDEINSVRLSINRSEIEAEGKWADKITWEELQQIKRECGYGDFYAIEIYPRDRDIVNVANMRHLWILSNPLEIGWFG